MKERRMIRFESVSKVFKTSAGQVTALSDINLTITLDTTSSYSKSKKKKLLNF